MVHDFHTHTFLSDGVLSPLELIRRAYHQEYKTIAITDHVGLSNQTEILKILSEECKYASEEWGIKAIPGVEITHVPKKLIGDAAKKARDLGAQIVIVHGETLSEPVEPGTNLEAVNSKEVDILAHPGLITEEEALLAVENKVYLEISARKGHSLTNGHVARLAFKTGANLILDSDAHEPEDLLTISLAEKIARGAGLSKDQISLVIKENPLTLGKYL